MKKYFQNILMAGVLISHASLYPFTVKTPTDLGNWLSANFEYKEDIEDYWQSPEETAKLKSGDCEDSGFLVDTVLSDLGYKSYTFAMTFDNRDTSHAINVLQIDNKYTMYSNFNYYDAEFNSIRALLNHYYPHWEKLYLISLKFPNKGILVKMR